MSIEDGANDANIQMKTIPNYSPKTIETYTGQETKEFSKTIFSTNKKKKKKKPSQLKIESRNTTTGFQSNYKKSSSSEKEL